MKKIKKMKEIMLPCFDTYDNDAMLDTILLITAHINAQADKLNEIIDFFNSQEEEKQKDREELSEVVV